MAHSPRIAPGADSATDDELPLWGVENAGGGSTAPENGRSVEPAQAWELEVSRVHGAPRESDALYRSLFLDSPVPLWIADFGELRSALDQLRAQGVADLNDYFANRPAEVATCRSRLRVIDANEAAVRLYEADTKSALANALPFTLVPDASPHSIESLVAIASGLPGASARRADRTLKGKPLMVSVRWSVVGDSSSDRTQAVVSIEDVTERVRHEERIEGLARFPNENPFPVLRVAVDGRVLFANPASVELLAAWTSSRRIPKSLRRAVAAASAEGVMNEAEVNVGTRRYSFVVAPIAGQGYVNLYGQDVTESRRMEAELRRVGAELERRVEAQTRELQAATEELRGEMRERRHADDALRESEDRFRAMFEQAAGSVVLADADTGALVEFNQQAHERLGYSREEFGRLSMADLEAGDSAEKAASRLCEVRRSGRDEYETQHRTNDGRLQDVLVSLRRIRLHGHTFVQGVWQDITERKRREERERIQREELFQASKLVALGTLVSGVAHEISNPNNFIMLNAATLQRTYAELQSILDAHMDDHRDSLVGGVPYTELGEEIGRAFSGILEGAKRINSIVNGLKDFARPRPSGLNEAVDLAAVVRTAVTLLANPIARATRRFSVELGDRVPSVQGNSQRLEQVVINLLQNACHALTSREKAIIVRTGHDPESRTVYVEVEDEGVGIPEEHLAHVLDPFFTTRRQMGGTGLGLSICAQIVESHRGSLDFHSTPSGGTRVQVTLPVRTDSPATAPAR